MKRIKILLMVALLVAPVAMPVSAKPHRERRSGYSVTNPNHTQRLGGRSERASRGLAKAALHSRSIDTVKGDVPAPLPMESGK